MEDCLHTSSENLSKLVSWAHSHGTICNLIPNLKHLLSEGSHGNLTAMWGCTAGHAYHWPLTATCRAGSQERMCYQDSRSFNSDSASVSGAASETQPSPGERFPGRTMKAKVDCNRTQDSCDFSNGSEPSEVEDNMEEYEDETALFDMVCESSPTDEDSDFETELLRQQQHSAPQKRPNTSPLPFGAESRPSCQNMEDSSSIGGDNMIVKKIKQEMPEDYYIVANAELTGGINGPALSLIQTSKQSQTPLPGPSSYTVPHMPTALASPILGVENDTQGVSISPPISSHGMIPMSVRGPVAGHCRLVTNIQASSQPLTLQMPVSTSGANQQINIPLSALQIPRQAEHVPVEELVKPSPKPVASCEVALSPSMNTEPEVSSSQQQSNASIAFAMDGNTEAASDIDERQAEANREQNEKTIRSTQTSLRNFGYHAKLNKFPVFNFNDELKDLCVSAVSANTTKATLYALNVWRYWCMTKGLKDYMDITKIPAPKLNELLGDFYVSVKKTDGSDFLATSLHAIRRGLDRILKNAGVGFSITSGIFNSSSQKLKEKLHVLSKAGMSGARSRNIIYFSLNDEEEMWRTGCLGDEGPVALLSTVVKYNSQFFNMRTLQEHADLMFGDVELLKDSDNRPFFGRTDSVKREKRVSSNTKVCYGQVYHEHSRGQKRCPYCLLYKYMYTHRPPTLMDPCSPFYLAARKEMCSVNGVWYEEQRMGLRSLRGVVPKLAKKVRLEQCDNFTFVSFTQASRKFSHINHL
ncbi:uncharacterized protein KIAA1958-like isoform X2 [Polyodon spathula]|uniref:uncharacterized protein KIAA1958-like isoform X2 n=1 Tax=Polyodon spathula TaxID=7913 RepID=UPI001B7DBA37|nr:uncharacterized protein KIAA1958-like isoform X2 [Polyodon spathula]